MMASSWRLLAEEHLTASLDLVCTFLAGVHDAHLCSSIPTTSRVGGGGCSNEFGKRHVPARRHLSAGPARGSVGPSAGRLQAPVFLAAARAVSDLAGGPLSWLGPPALAAKGWTGCRSG